MAYGCSVLFAINASGVDKVLILDSTVYNGMNSLEAQTAAALGYTVDLVSPTTWASMSASDFSAYRAIILGDPGCGVVSRLAAAEANRAVWGPVVNGNVIIVGTDPTVHLAGGAPMTLNGIRFAADQAGKTGLYITLSCYYHTAPTGTPVTVLDPFGTFTTREVGCYNQAHVVVTHPAMSSLTDAVLSNWGCSVHEGFETWPTAGPDAFLVLAIAENAGTSYTGPDLSVGSPYILVRGEGLAPVTSRFSLSPLTGDNPTNSDHTVCATVVINGAPAAGIDVTFTVTSGPNSGQTATLPTAANGQACFTYTGLGGVGTDTIIADVPNPPPGQNFAPVSATKTWFNPCGAASLTATAFVYCHTNKLLVGFNEIVTPQSATDISHYDLDHGLTVINVTALAPKTVMVETDQDFEEGTTYTLRISDVEDLCGRFIAPNPSEVTVQCQVLCPDFQCPSNMIVQCEGPGGTEVHYDAHLNPACTNFTLTCIPPSGSYFPGGTSVVVCHVSNASNTAFSCSFTVTVTDPLPPIIECPPDIVVTATTCTNAMVDFTVTATDNCTVDPQIVCTPSAGSFPVGTTPVHCVATDGNGNTNSCDFTVTVLLNPAYSGASAFDTDADGWMVVDRDASGYPANLLNELSLRSPGFFSPDGFIQADDGVGEWFWRAPAKYLGDQSAVYGGQLRFDLWSDLLYAPVADDPYNILLVSSNNLVLYLDLPDPSPEQTWVPYCVELKETAGWKIFPSGQAASSSDMMNVLAQLEKFDIHGEFGDGPDTGRLDNVGWIYCGAEPLCEVNITCSTNITVLTCSESAVVDYPPPVATSSHGSIVIVSNYPPPGVFPLGTTPVICTATDRGGHTDTCVFSVTVVNPTLLCPSNIVLDCTNQAGRVVNYPPQLAGVACTPPSGSLFSIGVTPVTCVSTSVCGTISTCVFTVTVRGHGTLIGQWVKSNCNSPLTRANAIAVDARGGIYVGGTFSGSTNFCGVSLVSSGDRDGFVARYDQQGNLLWVRQIAGPGIEEVNGVAIDSEGNCCVVGTFVGDGVSLPDPAYPLSIFYLTSGGADIFLAGYSPNGAVLWKNVCGGAGDDAGEGIAADGNGNVYITGQFSGPADFGGISLAGSSDAYLAKRNAAGDIEWAIASASTAPFGVNGRSVAIDRLRNRAFITGFFSGNPAFGSSVIGPHTGYGNAFVAQVNIAGVSPSWIWARQTFCPSGSSYCDSHDGMAIGVHGNSGDCYFAAYYHGAAAIGTAANQKVSFPLTDKYSTLVGSFTTAGSPRWLVNLGASGDDEPRGLAVDQAGGDVYVSGFMSGFDVTADGGRNVDVYQLNPANGAVKSVRVAYGSSEQRDNAARSVAVDSAGCVYLAGSYNDRSLVFYDFIDGVHKLSTPAVNTKLFVAKYCPACSTNCVPPVITGPLQNPWITSGPSSSNPVVFTVTVSGTPPFTFDWLRNNVVLPPPGGPGYTITVSPDGMSSTLRLTAVPGGGSFDSSTYKVEVANHCCPDCDRGPVSSQAHIFYWNIVDDGGFSFAHRRLGVMTGTGTLYSVEYRDNLNPATPWQFLTNLTGLGTNAVIFDLNPDPIMRFYRIPLQADP